MKINKGYHQLKDSGGFFKGMDENNIRVHQINQEGHEISVDSLEGKKTTSEVR